MFIVAVKIEGMDRRRKTTGLMHIVVGFFLLIKSTDLYSNLIEKSLLKILPFLLVGGLSLLYGFLRSRYDVTAKYNSGLRFLQFMTFFSFGFLMMRLGKSFDYVILFVWAFVTFMLIFSERRIFAETNIVFTEEGIRIPGSYREHLVRWNVLESVVVRHDFITLLHQGKKYLQYQVMQDLSELEVVKMNTFCKEKIEQLNRGTEEQEIANNEENTNSQIRKD